MKFTINKRLAALVLATAVVSSQFQTVAFATGNINIIIMKIKVKNLKKFILMIFQMMKSLMK